jgi:hypothetical protein
MGGEVKAWTCSGDRCHVLGVVRRNGSGVRQLYLYRQAVDVGSEGGEMAEVDVIAVVEGYVTDVRCSICGEVRTWFPGKEALARMVRQAQEINRLV